MGGDFAAGSGEAAGVQLQYAGGSVTLPSPKRERGIETRSLAHASGSVRSSMANQLIDTFGRVHNNLRISVTDRCNLRCTYCMPEDVTFLDKAELLTFEEIVHFVRVAVPLGVNKLRLTGGEPLLRKDLPKLVEMLRDITGVNDLGLTTNALLLAQQ